MRLVVSGPPLADQGDSRSWRLSRLRWLDSTLGTSPAVPYPFTPVTAHFTPAQSATHAVGSAVTAEADREAVGRGASVDGGWSSRLLANLGMSNLGPTQAGEGRWRRQQLRLSSRMASMLLGVDGLPAQLYAGVNAGEGSTTPRSSRGSSASEAEAEAAAEGAAGRAVLRSPIRFVVHLADRDRDRGGTAGGVEVAWSVVEAAALVGGLSARQEPEEGGRRGSRGEDGGGGDGGGGGGGRGGDGDGRDDGVTASNSGGASAEVGRWRSKLVSSDGCLELTVEGEWWFDSQATLSLGLHARCDVEIVQSSLLVSYDIAPFLRL